MERLSTTKNCRNVVKLIDDSEFYKLWIRPFMSFNSSYVLNACLCKTLRVREGKTIYIRSAGDSGWKIRRNPTRQQILVRNH